MKRSSVLLLALFGFSIGTIEYSLAASKGKARIVDDVELQDDQAVKGVADRLCGPKNDEGILLSRKSTIRKLYQYFESQAGQSLVACREQHFQSLKDLNELISVENENVCEDEKIRLIESYHHKYIPTHVQSNDNKSTLSKLLEVFFFNYVSEINEICHKSLIDKINEDSATNKHMELLDERTLNKTITFFGSNSDIHDYDDIMLIWDLIKGASVMLEQKPEVMRFKLKDPSNIWLLQDKCAQQFKPVYSKLVLPIVRLADLGYSLPKDKYKRELKDLKSNRTVRRLYSLTQLCDALLPIEFYQDDKEQDAGRMVLFGGKDSLDSLKSRMGGSKDSTGDEKQTVYEVETNKMLQDQLAVVEQIKIKKFIKKLYSRQRARAKKLRRILRRFGKSFKNFAKTSQDKLIVSSPATVDLKPIVKESFKTIDEMELIRVRLSDQIPESSKPISWREIVAPASASPKGQLNSNIRSLLVDLVLGLFMVVSGVSQTAVQCSVRGVSVQL